MDTATEKKSGVTFHLWNQSLWQGQNVSLNLFSAIVSHSELFKWAMVDICIYTYIYTPAVWHNLKGSYGLFEKQVPVEFLHLWPMGEHLSCIYAKFSCPCFAYLEIWMVSRSPKFPVFHGHGAYSTTVMSSDLWNSLVLLHSRFSSIVPLYNAVHCRCNWGIALKIE